MGEVETRTARKKRLKAERKAGVDLQLAAAERARVDRSIQNLSARLCSIWWAEHVARNRGPYLPDTPCDCSHCRRRRKWPSVNFGSRNISFECFTLAHAPPEKTDRWRRVSHAEAASVGLHIIRRRAGEHNDTPKGISVLVAGCERCEGLKVKGDRFCIRCAALVKQEMEDSGYFNAKAPLLPQY